MLFRSYKVKGVSMYPTFAQGDKVFAFKCKEYKLNDIVVLKNPGCFKDKRVIKRIRMINPGAVYVEGDNKKNSHDSRDVGWIDKKYIIGKVYGALPGGKMDFKEACAAAYKWLEEDEK